MPFKTNEVLATKALKKADFKIMASLKGEISSTLGRKFQSHYAWNRPIVLNFKKYDKVFKNISGAKLKWEIKTDSKLKNILFVVKEGSKPIGEAIIFSKLADIAKEAEVINLQAKDGTMQRASGKQAKKFNLDEKKKSTYNDPRKSGPVKEKKTDLSAINKHKKIVLCGHGGGSDVSGGFVATRFGGRSAKDIANFLKKEGLQHNYSGTIYLSGCHSAAGFDNPKNFAKTVRDLLAKAGYKKLSVAGTPGVSTTDSAGNKHSLPAALAEDIKKTVARTQKLIVNLRKSLAKTNTEIKKITPEYDSASYEFDRFSTEIEWQSPEVQTKLKKVILTPLKASRDELKKSLDQMEASKKTLEKGIKHEEEYLKKLKKMATAKGKYEKKEINKIEYYVNTQPDLWVEEWWGVFGPAQKTKLKAGGNFKKLKSTLLKLRSKLLKKTG